MDVVEPEQSKESPISADQCIRPDMKKLEKDAITEADGRPATQYLTLEFEGLPPHTDNYTLKQMYLKNMHVIKSEPDINNISGQCSGKAKVRVRCQNGLRSDSLLKSLYQKGAKFRVQERRRDTDTQKVATENNKNKQLLEQHVIAANAKNQWLGLHETLIERQKREQASREAKTRQPPRAPQQQPAKKLYQNCQNYQLLQKNMQSHQ